MSKQTIGCMIGKDMLETRKSITCEVCGSENVVRFGSNRYVQKYRCKDCAHSFKGDDTFYHMHVVSEFISSALVLYYTGSSIFDICEYFRDVKGYNTTKTVISYWIRKYTDMAIEHFMCYKPMVGSEWACTETIFWRRREKTMWFLDIVDVKTRFLIASRSSFTRIDVKNLIEAVKQAIGITPTKVINDRLYAHWDEFELSVGADIEDVQNSLITGNSSDSLERWHCISKQRIKVVRNLRNIDTIVKITGGFSINYNYLTPQKLLNSKTPAEIADVDYKIKDWMDVCKLPTKECIIVKDYIRL